MIEGEAELIRGVASALQDRGHSLLVRFAAEGGGTLAPVLEANGIADGFIFLGDRASGERVRYLLKENIPFATYGRTSADPKHAFHDFDYSGFAKLAVATLKRRGARRILLLHSITHLTRSRLLEKGLREACERQGVPELVLRHVTRDFAKSVPLPEDRLLGSLLVTGDGVILCDQHAIESTVTAANALGLRVGHEVFLFARCIGSQLSSPQYGNIDIVVDDLELAGRELASAVLQLIGGKPPEGLHRLQSVSPVYPPDAAGQEP
ncbi:substrate-binding domain-containing protein [Devosia sp.]|uniref:substrate-binding domain-containing protein n=1 Tax=Devosia sp. TaxID=1871048 RepID=UPI0026368D18|nr:substrate-binding domain-containing protein [Devosia sp.]